MKKRCTALCTGLWISGIVAAAAVILSKEEYRTKVKEEVKEASQCATDVLKFVRDNREQIIQQVRVAANDVATTVQEVSENIKQLRKTANQLKDSSEEIVKVTREAATEIKNLK